MNNQPKEFHGPTNMNINQFEVLSQDIESFVCHDFEHEARNCRYKDMAILQDKNKIQSFTKPWKHKKMWREKQGKPKTEEYKLVLQAHDHEIQKGCLWILFL
jgi:hypothetical protein